MVTFQIIAGTQTKEYNNSVQQNNTYSVSCQVTVTDIQMTLQRIGIGRQFFFASRKLIFKTFFFHKLPFFTPILFEYFSSLPKLLHATRSELAVESILLQSHMRLHNNGISCLVLILGTRIFEIFTDICTYYLISTEFF